MFEKYSNNPVVPRTPDTFYAKYAANPDILEFKDQVFFYFRGQDFNNHDQMGVFVGDKDSFDGINWKYRHNVPILKVNENPEAYDSNHILDPAAIVIDDKVYLYYSSHSIIHPHSVSLAISEDGINFTKHDKNPLVENAVVPEVLIKDGKVHLFYQRWTAGSKGVSNFYMNTSDDGINFDLKNEVMVSSPDADSQSISTNRIFYENGVYYSFFGNNKRFKDYPETIRIARSTDLLKWEKSPIDVIQRGQPGSWDEGALWFATVYKDKDTYYLWYEGTGTGNGRKTPKDIEESDACVNQSYGGYGKFSFSQIGMATYNKKLEDFFK